MRWVLDTDVLVSALLKAGTPPQSVLEKATSCVFECVVSEAILTEYRQVLARPKLKISSENAEKLLDFFRGGIFVQDAPSDHRLPDAKGQAFLDAALAGGASAVVTGNTRDFPASICLPIRILTPREALAELEDARTRKPK